MLLEFALDAYTVRDMLSSKLGQTIVLQDEDSHGAIFLQNPSLRAVHICGRTEPGDRGVLLNYICHE